ncbi:Pupal cuticle protein 27 [Penaeus vannamei]|uniref:Pupal cuticle protein 27 n=1 Tax=Penaeus vannamei TaxID=6689 RepID=A0A3R7QP72_PENVA|nr:Pupal cuticle protein 27 [Penaeus vannamei]
MLQRPLPLNHRTPCLQIPPPPPNHHFQPPTVLSVAVVSTLSFPRPDAEYKIPTVGLGARSQYYVLHDDGTFKYGYDTGDGAYESAMANAPGDVSGSFGYKDASGADIKLDYTANDQGFLVSGSHLPVAPVADTAPLVSTKSAASTYDVPPAPSRSVVASQPAAPSQPVAASAPLEESQVQSSALGDGSYSFSYENQRSSRHETADALNNVKGRQIQYIAGADTGYIAEGDSLPQGPPVPGAESGIPTGRILPVLSEQQANELAAATSGSASASPLTAATYSSPLDSAPRDASYSFSYDAGQSSRSESADPNLNVQGTFSFDADDGVRRTVNYVAGSATGFVAEGDHLPIAPDVPSSDSHTQSSSPGVVSTKTAFLAPSHAAHPKPVAPAAPAEEVQVRSSTLDDGSYSFSYKTQSSSRHESAGAQNNVKGRYSFIADDDVSREIQYIAGADTGYIAEGDSLPQGPPVPGAETGIPTGRILPVLSEEEANALAGVSPLLKSGEGSDIADTQADASYRFSFDSDSYSRTEEADADGNIVGSYTYVDEDGKEHTVNFVAGRKTGFSPEGFPQPTAAAAIATASPGHSSLSKPSGVTAAQDASPVAITKVAGSSATSGTHTSQLIGDVFLHQYNAVNSPKYGYAFTAVR